MLHDSARLSFILHSTLVCALVGACGGAPDLEGIYQVTSHTLNEAGCDVEGPAAADDYPYFSLRPDDFLGESLLAFGTCTGPTIEECEDFGLFSSFLEIDGEWKMQISTASFAGTCTLGYFIGSTLEQPDGSLRLEFRNYSEVDETLDADACDTDVADARGTDMPCDRYEVVVGTLVE